MDYFCVPGGYFSGRELPRTQSRRSFARLPKRAGLPQIRFHDLRHAVADSQRAPQTSPGASRPRHRGDNAGYLFSRDPRNGRSHRACDGRCILLGPFQLSSRRAETRSSPSRPYYISDFSAFQEIYSGCCTVAATQRAPITQSCVSTLISWKLRNRIADSGCSAPLASATRSVSCKLKGTERSEDQAHSGHHGSYPARRGSLSHQSPS
jgi:hypothetical protein